MRAWWFPLFAMAIGGAAIGAEPTPGKLVTEDYFVAAKDEGIRLFVRNKRLESLSTPSAERILVYVHGATYPSETAFDLRLDGLSWMEFIAQRGFDVYLLDLRGYGRSTRPPEMDQPAQANAPLVRTDTAVRDIEAVVDHVLERRGVAKVNLIGWSWGTATMAAYASQHPNRVHKLVLYAPLWLRTTASPIRSAGPLGAYRTVTVDAARKRWLTGVAPEQQKSLIPAGWFEAWAQATWATDAWGAQQNPPVLRAPNGVLYDSQNYWAKDTPLYDPTKILAPTLLIHGDLDQDTPAYMSQNLFAKLTSAASKRYVVVGEGTHTLIMEKNRMQLFREVQLFLEE